MKNMFEQPMEEAIPSNEVKKEIESEPKGESMPTLTDEQIGRIVARVVESLNHKNRPTTEKMSAEASREDAFSRRLDEIILDKVDRISHSEGQERSDKMIRDAHAETKQYREDLAAGKFERK